MRHADDTITGELPGIKPLPAPRKPRAKKYATLAEKQAAYRARKGVTAITVTLPDALAAEFKQWLAAKGKTASPVIEKLIQTQLLRKR
ncbi:hypothetical protein GTP23_12060 [Pseudoduganella sp. FT93W]|uniref:Uncharacterized protein n=1 Tax=Duganella fentianensis TaxID=2692177 RepID=A0A845I243_9BURK|nr:hypothetical protein [Duganella fentianensis]MYN45781.1 hypothetical protein [Duganella fentianensis]